MFGGPGFSDPFWGASINQVSMRLVILHLLLRRTRSLNHYTSREHVQNRLKTFGSAGDYVFRKANSHTPKALNPKPKDTAGPLSPGRL